MSNAQLSPYLAFNGNCQEAMEFYHGVMGGELELHTFGELKMPGIPDSYKDKIMHGMLKNDALSFMASDSAPGAEYTLGSNISLSVTGTDADLLKKLWDGLSTDGQITMPLARQTWGDDFGMFTDKFGINWMINITVKKN